MDNRKTWIQHSQKDDKIGFVTIQSSHSCTGYRKLQNYILYHLCWLHDAFIAHQRTAHFMSNFVTQCMSVSNMLTIMKLGVGFGCQCPVNTLHGEKVKFFCFKVKLDFRVRIKQTLSSPVKTLRNWLPMSAITTVVFSRFKTTTQRK